VSVEHRVQRIGKTALSEVLVLAMDIKRGTHLKLKPLENSGGKKNKSYKTTNSITTTTPSTTSSIGRNGLLEKKPTKSNDTPTKQGGRKSSSVTEYLSLFLPREESPGPQRRRNTLKDVTYIPGRATLQSPAQKQKHNTSSVKSSKSPPSYINFKGGSPHSCDKIVEESTILKNDIMSPQPVDKKVTESSSPNQSKPDSLINYSSVDNKEGSQQAVEKTGAFPGSNKQKEAVPQSTTKRLLHKLYSFSRQGSLSAEDGAEDDIFSGSTTSPTMSANNKDFITNADGGNDENSIEEKEMTEEEAELNRKAEEFARQKMRSSTFARKYRFMGNPTESFAEEQTQEVKTSVVKTFYKDDDAFGPEDSEQAANLKLQVTNLVGALEEEERREIFARNKTKGLNNPIPGRSRRLAKNLFTKKELNMIIELDIMS
jgi:hypothetical protein